MAAGLAILMRPQAAAQRNRSLGSGVTSRVRVLSGRPGPLTFLLPDDCDVTREREVRALVDAAINEFSHCIDVKITRARVGVITPCD